MTSIDLMISFIVPVYNTELYLESCIESRTVRSMNR